MQSIRGDGYDDEFWIMHCRAKLVERAGPVNERFRHQMKFNNDKSRIR